MAIVIPRARSSGALSIESNERYSASPFIASTFVIAAVSVVFPWSTCPIVPTFTCGFVRSNFALAMEPQKSLQNIVTEQRRERSSRRTVIRSFVTPFRDVSPRRLSVTPSLLTFHLCHNFFGFGFRLLLIMTELHAVDRAALAHGA